MNTMIGLALKNAVANRARFAMTGMAVALSVAFLVATLSLSNSMRGTASRDVALANQGIDAVVEGATVAEHDGGPGELGGDARRSLPPETVEAVRGVAGVAVAEPVTVGFAKVVADGRALGTGTAVDVGRSWVDDPELNPYQLVDGEAPRGLSEIAIDRQLADDADLVVGASVEVLTSTGLHSMTITGIVRYGASDAAPLQRTTLFGADAAGSLMGLTEIDQVLLRLDPADDAADDAEVVLGSVARAAPAGVVATGEAFTAAQQEAVTTPLQFLSIFLLTFAVVATLTGITIIYNTFALTMARRRQEMALLRSIGAERRQVMRSIILEAVFVGVGAAAVGLVLGIVGVGAARLLVGLAGLTLPPGEASASATTLLIGFATGLVATVASAWFPAQRAAGAAPVEALREAAAEPRRIGSVRTAAGVVCVVLAIVGGAVAVATSAPALLTALALLLPGLILAGPLVVRGAVAIARPVVVRVSGVEGAIASANLTANLRRAASTSLALTLCTAMVAFFAVIASTLSSSITDDLADGLRADIVVTSATPDYATVDPALAGELTRIAGVEAAAGVARVEGAVDGEPAIVAGIPANFSAVFDLDVAAGSLGALALGGVAVVQQDVATAMPELGSEVTIELEGAELTVPVVAVVGRSLGGFDAAGYFVNQRTLRRAAPGVLDALVYVAIDDDVASNDALIGQTRKRIADVVAATPGALYETGTSYLAGADSEVAAIRDFIYAMLGLAGVIALLGVANTTALSISERTRELGLLRAIGATQTSVRSIVRLEATLMSLAAAVVGVTVAAGAAWALINVTGGEALAGVTFPPLALCLIAGIAVLGGTLMAAVPAWRASRRPVLDALAGDNQAQRGVSPRDEAKRRLASATGSPIR